MVDAVHALAPTDNLGRIQVVSPYVQLVLNRDIWRVP